MTAEHKCEPPDLGEQIVMRTLPTWECGVCGRIWTVGVAGSFGWWQETRGPTTAQEERTP